jgi:predicted nucleic acid-binding protein
MTILIDSMIWIYFFDINSKENLNVKKWMERTLSKEKILLSPIIPLEVGHNLYRVPNIDKNLIENLLLKWLTQKNLQIIDINELIMVQALESLKNLRQLGIGGRDCIILTTMELSNVDTIITHDKNILSLNSINRIDPVFQLPITLNIGEDFNRKEFNEKSKNFE